MPPPELDAEARRVKVTCGPLRAFDAPGVPLDVSPGTADPLGASLGAVAAADLPEGLWDRFLDGSVEEIEMVLLGSVAAAHAARVASAPEAAFLADLGPEVRVVCDCVQHGYGHCLRLAVASGLAVGLGPEVSFGGEWDLGAAPPGSARGAPRGGTGSDWSEEWRLAFSAFEAAWLAEGEPDPAPARPSAPASAPTATPRASAPAAAPRASAPASAPTATPRASAAAPRASAAAPRASAPAAPPGPPVPWFARRLGLGGWLPPPGALKAAWSKAVIAAHPDRGGSSTALHEVVTAYRLAQSVEALGLAHWPPSHAALRSAVGRVNAAMALEGLNRDDPKYITFVQHFQRVREALVAESR